MNDNQPLSKSSSIGDTSIEYLHYPSDGPDLLLLHATGFIPWLWHPIAKSLIGYFNIIVPDLSGHRNNEPEDGGIGWDLIAGDLSRLCENLQFKTPFITGHSMGGTVATLAAALYDLHPARMILIEPIFLPETIYGTKMTVEQHPLASKSILRRSKWENRDDALSYLKSKKLFSRWDGEMLELYLEHGMIPDDEGGLTLTCSPRKEASLFMGGNAKNPWPLLNEIKCPVLLVEGEKSDNKLFIDLKKAQSMLPEAMYYEVKNAGHLIPMEEPGIITDLIKKFCSGQSINS